MWGNPGTYTLVGFVAVASLVLRRPKNGAFHGARATARSEANAAVTASRAGVAGRQPGQGLAASVMLGLTRSTQQKTHGAKGTQRKADTEVDKRCSREKPEALLLLPFLRNTAHLHSLDGSVLLNLEEWLLKHTRAHACM